ncbi:MAG: tetratricopeptide repeat protein [Vicinamibacterales bacterium]
MWTGLAVLTVGLGLAAGRESLRLSRASRLPAPPDAASLPPAVAERIGVADRRARSAPASGDAVGALGLAYQANLLVSHALAAYELAETLAPDDWRWPYARSLVFEDRGDVDETVGALERALHLNEGLAAGWYRLGDAEFKRGRYEEALSAFARVDAWEGGGAPAGGAPEGSRTPPASAYAAFGRARVAWQRGDADEVTRLLEPVVNGAGADFGPAHRLLAQAERRLDHPDRASRHERRADALGAYVPLSDAFVDTLCRESAHSTFLLKHAALAARARNPRWREWLLRRAIDVDPTNPDVVFEMATMLQATSRSTEALELYRRHETLVPGEVQTQVQIGKCLTALNRLDEAEAVLRRAAARGDAVASYNLGELLDRTNRDDEAAGQYAAALAIDPFHARALNNLALVLTRKGRMGDALPLYERAVAAAPNDPDPRNNLGSAWLQMGRVREAVASFEEALAIDPDHVDALNNIAIGLQALGRRDDALSYLRRALALSPSHVGARQNLRELGGEHRP